MKLTASSIRDEIIKGNIDIEDYILKKLELIRKNDKKINAFISIDSEEFLRERARNIKMEINSGKKPMLAGIAISIKDVISTSFLPTTAGSKILEGYVPPFNATVVEKILKEGGIIIGKTNLDEFAMGSTTEFSAYGPTRNPWDLERVAGGSSGGSAASLSYGAADLSLGSDTGGSARLPASYTCTFGLKPTYGLVSRYGLIPYANSLEQISPMARSVEDLALLLKVIKGYDEKDATSIPRVKENNYERFKVCVIEDLVRDSDRPIKSSLYNLLHKLELEGIETEYREKLDYINYALPVYYTIAFAEASSNLARYDGKLYGRMGNGETYKKASIDTRRSNLGLEVRKRILMGVLTLSEGFKNEYYIAATKGRRLIRDEILKVTKDCILVSPVSPILPPRIGEKIGDPLKLYAMDVYTVIANLAGIPALALPSSFYNGLPIGIQFMGKPFSEGSLIRLGLIIEKITGISGVIASG
ncbi:MAG: Asp-tRNA(Asn)/Glu-tRNA(Gln) amidotransferase subunit GatA [Caldisphaeraceae archaeon]|nr:Asp-tRNA(Asn)/Glu-tRNA(Gln) amidotransferase subunit GatA [Caldisphaeraceae archaeon]MEB3691631.1 Asp-tRNA(Asn)/Glu-tRNA(Gln) amidotransferase subunit GatA [Caldisphaeraceae archaeon]MEB3798020.1 Asp-tRNA(Asn)/Glu-tRNA(Gln) amidotransferase subunit GatA [Caldisphaeraceae archaeon]